MDFSISAERCVLCISSEDNALELGEKLHKDGITAHYYCLLLSSGLVQGGNDDEGLMGFLPKDINAEAARVRFLKCFFCKKMRANIGCCNTKCRRTFHTGCSIKSKCLSRMCDTFPSYCFEHIPKQRIVKRHKNKETCGICLDTMGKYHLVTSITTSCCSKWFHRLCLMKVAQNAGYFFKCPLCNNTETFRKEVVNRGIFIPDRDASWETEPNAFAELLQRTQFCVATNCVCPHGRDYEDAEYEVTYCNTCGSACIHDYCWTERYSFVCDDCKIVPEVVNPAVNSCGDDAQPDVDIEQCDDRIGVTDNYTMSETVRVDDMFRQENVTAVTDNLSYINNSQPRENMQMDSLNDSDSDLDVRRTKRFPRNTRLLSNDDNIHENSIDSGVKKTSDESDVSVEKTRADRENTNNSLNIENLNSGLKSCQRNNSLSSDESDDYCLARLRHKLELCTSPNSSFNSRNRSKRRRMRISTSDTDSDNYTVLNKRRKHTIRKNTQRMQYIKDSELSSDDSIPLAFKISSYRLNSNGFSDIKGNLKSSSSDEKSSVKQVILRQRSTVQQNQNRLRKPPPRNCKQLLSQKSPSSSEESIDTDHELTTDRRKKKRVSTNVVKVSANENQSNRSQNIRFKTKKSNQMTMRKHLVQLSLNSFFK